MPITPLPANFLTKIPTAALASWAPGRLDIVGVFEGGNFVPGQVFHKAWMGDSWAPPEPDQWDLLGGFLNPAPAIVCWGENRLDIFGVSNLANPSMLHKAWDGQQWLPSHDGWDALGGSFLQPPAVASWGPDRLDILGVGSDGAMMLHKAWDGSRWLPSHLDWDPLGAASPMQPAVASWSANRLDIVAVGFDHRMLHKAWDGHQWLPGQFTWDVLGGQFSQPPAIVSWGPDRLDIFGVSTDGLMLHKAWDGSQWLPSQLDWDPLGGAFSSQPAVASWAADRLDVFGVADDRQMLHKAWDGSEWLPSHQDWDAIGGVFSGAPAVTAWAEDRLDIVAVGNLPNAVVEFGSYDLFHKAWDGSQWLPSATEWERLGRVGFPSFVIGH